MDDLKNSGPARAALEQSRKIAVLGAHPERSKAAHYVPRYLESVGYELYPVNPTCLGTTLFGKPVVASLRELSEAVDAVVVFRRSEHLPAHVPEVLALEPLPKFAWFQLGIRHDEAAQRLEAAGIQVIQNRCMMIDHQRLF